jgi:hypothetical protein
MESCQVVHIVMEHAGIKTEKAGLSVLTGIIDGRRRPWQNSEVEFE